MLIKNVTVTILLQLTVRAFTIQPLKPLVSLFFVKKIANKKVCSSLIIFMTKNQEGRTFEVFVYPQMLLRFMSIFKYVTILRN